jgi:RimJ/RimL family protein N-acetyltransferase
MTVTLREVTQEDLPIFFEDQLDAEATRMAAFPSRDRDAFMAYWARIMSKETNATGILNTILADDTVAGNVVYWEAAGEPNIGYWLGKAHWGKGIASAALAQFLTKIEARPVYAHVAKHNFASIRVLKKCGFQLLREERCEDDDVEELVMELRSDCGATDTDQPTNT